MTRVRCVAESRLNGDHPMPMEHEPLTRKTEEALSMSLFDWFRTGSGYAVLMAVAVIALFGSTAGPASAQEFGLEEVDVSFLNQDGTPATQAGSHPFEMSTSFTVNNNGMLPDGAIKDLQIEQAPGFVGDADANPRCSLADFYARLPGSDPGSNRTSCNEENTAVGVAAVWVPPFTFYVPVLNLEPPRGVASRVGFVVIDAFTIVDIGVKQGGQHNITASARNLSQVLPIMKSEFRLWGNPSDAAHDPLRGPCGLNVSVDFFEPTFVYTSGPFGSDCPTSAGSDPFLTLPTSCTGPAESVWHAAPWEDPDAWLSGSVLTHDGGSPPTPLGFSGCESLGFTPEVSSAPSITNADSPTGLDFEIEFDQDGLTSPNGLAQSTIDRAVVSLPEGVSANPSLVNGLATCSPDELESEQLEGPASSGCPAASKIGTVEVDTPLLGNKLGGVIYMAEQDDPATTQPGAENPFDSLLAFYIVIKDPISGTLVRIPAEVQPDPETGQLVTTVDDVPQIPFSKFYFHFRGGTRAPLVNPPTCGIYEITTELTPSTAVDPDNPSDDEIVSEKSSFVVDEGPNGGPCISGDPSKAGDVADRAARPFGPEMSAGLENASASSYSPFSLRLSRPEGDQELSALSLEMPEGVTAKLAGVDSCSDNVLSAISQGEGTGAAENASPSCPTNSQVGTATVGAGAGSNPYYVQTGKAYLAGPYKGAQLSLAVVVPALAGPFDLGTTVVRSKLNVDKRTAQVSVESDPLPQILHGIPLKLRDVRINVDREGFMKAPTDCSEKQINAEVQGSHGKSASLTNRFQVGDCASLGFSPKLDLSFGNAKKNTKPNAHPPLNAKLSFNENDTNIRSVEVALPQGLLLDQERLGRICSRANYQANTCPEESRVGYAKATTPLLDDPVEGPVYLKASDNPLPDLAADLNGQIDVDLFGKIDQKLNKKGLNQIRNTFDIVPDVPVSSFRLTLDGGNDGLLVNSRNICNSKSAQKLSIEMQAHNDMSLSEKPLIGSACKQINKKKAAKLNKQAKKLLAKAKSTKNKKKAKQLRKQARKLKQQARQLGR